MSRGIVPPNQVPRLLIDLRANQNNIGGKTTNLSNKVDLCAWINYSIEQGCIDVSQGPLTPIVTASNGLYEDPDNNVKLGGNPLEENTTIDGIESWGFTFDNLSSFNVEALSGANSATLNMSPLSVQMTTPGVMLLGLNSAASTISSAGVTALVGTTGIQLRTPYVLTSDPSLALGQVPIITNISNGLVEYGDITQISGYVAPYTADSGVYLDGSTIKLGTNSLTEDTTIDGTSFSTASGYILNLTDLKSLQINSYDRIDIIGNQSFINITSLIDDITLTAGTNLNLNSTTAVRIDTGTEGGNYGTAGFILQNKSVGGNPGHLEWIDPDSFGYLDGFIVGNGPFINLSNVGTATVPDITATLSATGTPDATTFLRGDNTWASITVAPVNIFEIVTSGAGSNPIATPTKPFMTVNKTAITGGDTDTLPNTAGLTVGQVFILKDTSQTAFTNNWTIDTFGGAHTIDGSATLTLNQDGQSYTIQWDGTTYNII